MIFQRIALLLLSSSAGVALAFVPPSPSSLMLRQSLHQRQEQRQKQEGLVLALLSDENQNEPSYPQEDSSTSNNFAQYDSTTTNNKSNSNSIMSRQAAAFLTMTVLATSSLPPLSYAAAASVQAPKVETKAIKKGATSSPAAAPIKKAEPALPAEKRAVIDAKMGLDLAQKSLASTSKSLAAAKAADDKALSADVAAEGKVTAAKKTLIQNNDKFTSLKSDATANPALVNSASLKVGTFNVRTQKYHKSH